MANGPVIPTGYYYTPALRNMGAEGFFEGVLGGLDRAMAQDMARERLRAAREARNAKNAELAAGLAGAFGSGDPLADLMAGQAAGATGGRRASRGRAAGGAAAGGMGADPVSLREAQDRAEAAHNLAAINRALGGYETEYDIIGQGSKYASFANPRTTVRTAGPEDVEAVQPGFSEEAIAQALLEDASLEDKKTRALRDALIADAEAFPGEGLVDDGYREELAAMSDEEFDRVYRQTPEGMAEALAGPRVPSRSPRGPGFEADRRAAGPRELIAEFQRAKREEDRLIAEANQGGPEGFSDAPLSSFVSQLQQPDPREARSRQALSDAYRTMLATAEEEAASRAGMSPDEYRMYLGGESPRDRDIAKAEESLDPNTRRMMAEMFDEFSKAEERLDPNTRRMMDEMFVRPEPAPELVGRTDGETSALRLLDKMEKRSAQLEGRMGKKDISGALWNPAVDIGLDKRTILDPSTLAAIAELEGAGDARATRFMRQMGMDVKKSKKAFREGLTGDVQAYRGKLAQMIEEDVSLAEDAGASPEEAAKVWMASMNRRYNRKVFDLEDPSGIAEAMMVLKMPLRERLQWVEAFDQTMKDQSAMDLAKTRGELEKEQKSIVSRSVFTHRTPDKLRDQKAEDNRIKLLTKQWQTVYKSLMGVKEMKADTLIKSKQEGFSDIIKEEMKREKELYNELAKAYQDVYGIRLSRGNVVRSGELPESPFVSDAASTGVIETPKGVITPRMIGMVTEEIYNRESSGIVENPFFIHENVINGVVEELRKEGVANPEKLAPLIQEAIDAIDKKRFPQEESYERPGAVTDPFKTTSVDSSDSGSLSDEELLRRYGKPGAN